MKDLVIRMIYCEMLGHATPWGYIHALNMTQDPDIVLKRTGFLAVSLFLRENHELTTLVIHSLQKVCTTLAHVCTRHSHPKGPRQSESS
jgi:AP-4 complex subunit epsilon-1